MTVGAYFTICANNYLHYALSLARSLQRADPEIPFFVFVVDQERSDLYGPFAPNSVINVNALQLQRWNELSFKYNILELNTAVKPSCIKYLFANKGIESAIYLDPDIWVMKGLSEIFLLLRSGYSAVLTPHICRPIEDDKLPQDLDILRAGTFNLGFCGFSAQTEALNFLDWWERKLADFCYSDFLSGMFVDQKWCDFAPSFLSNLHIARDPGYNLAYWNIEERPLDKIGMDYFIEENPLYFVHFSGIDPSFPEQFSKYQNRFIRSDLGILREVYDEYLENLEENKKAFPVDPSTLPYSFNMNRNGQKIGSSHRYAYRTQLEMFRDRDPFSLDLSELEAGLATESDPSPQLTFLLRAMTSRRKTLVNCLSVWFGGSERRRIYWLKKFHSRGIRFPNN